MAYRLVVLETAQKEYDSILYYLTEVLKAPHAAASFHEEFLGKLRLVLDMPQALPLSKSSKLAALGYRAIFVKRYIALYRIEEDDVVLAHIFHQTQNYAKYV